MEDSQSGDILRRLKEAIFTKRPILAEILHKHGKKNLLEYTKGFLDIKNNPAYQERRKEFIECIGQKVKERLGDKISEEVILQLEKFPLVSTSDHHVPLTHFWPVNSNIVFALPCIEAGLKYLVCLTVSSISLSNSSCPRGILFHASANGEGNVSRMYFFPDAAKMNVVYTMNAYDKMAVKKAPQSEKLNALLDEIFFAPEILNSNTLPEQITKINYKLFPKFFRDEDKTPKVIYIEYESIVADVLIKYHLTNEESIIHRALFNPVYELFIKQYFNGIQGAFDLNEQTGTYFFWGIDAKNHRVRLMKNGHILASYDNSISFKWNPESIRNALLEKKIYPSMLMSYIVMNFYYGMKSLGGFNQVNYLTEMKNAWMSVLASKGKYKEIEVFIRSQTKELNEGLTLAYFVSANGELSAATGVDLALSEKKNNFSDYIELARHITLEDVFDPTLPEIYKVVMPQPKRDPLLSKLMISEILKLKHIADKINISLFKKII